MTDESVLDEILSAGDYEIVMCVLFAEVLAGDMPEQCRNLRMEALMHLRTMMQINLTVKYFAWMISVCLTPKTWRSLLQIGNRSVRICKLLWRHYG